LHSTPCGRCFDRRSWGLGRGLSLDIQPQQPNVARAA
jgi:hypothetical protein